MHKTLRISINILFFLTVIVIASTIATMALVKKIEKNQSQYNDGIVGVVVKQQVPILALSRGIVKKVYIRPGVSVAKNDLILELENPVLAGKIAALGNYPDNVSAQTEAKVAQEEMKGWKIYSPVDGVITDLLITEGSPVQELMNVANIYSNENILMLANLSDDQYLAVQQLHEITAYSNRLNQNFAIQPDILQPDEKVDELNEKKIGLYFRFNDKDAAQSLLHNEDLELRITQQDTKIIKPIDYIINFWQTFLGKQKNHDQ